MAILVPVNRNRGILTSLLFFLTREHKSISSRNRLMFCLLYGLTQSIDNQRNGLETQAKALMLLT